MESYSICTFEWKDESLALGFADINHAITAYQLPAWSRSCSLVAVKEYGGSFQKEENKKENCLFLLVKRACWYFQARLRQIQTQVYHKHEKKQCLQPPCTEMGLILDFFSLCASVCSDFSYILQLLETKKLTL